MPYAGTFVSPNSSNVKEANPLFGGGAQLCHISDPLSEQNHDKCDAIYSTVGSPSKFTPVAMAIIAIGMMFQGFGKSPRQSFITTYIDDNVNKQKTACFIGKSWEPYDYR